MKFFCLSLVLVCGLSCGQTALSQALVGEGKKLASELATELKTELASTLTAGSFENAVKVCKQAAPKIAKRIASENSATVTRVSTKYRSPNNQPDLWEADVLAFFEKNPFKSASIYHEDGNTPIRYMQAIKTEALCLNCHGTKMTNELKNVVHTYYPNDLATGYALGDIRGAFSISWPNQKASVAITNFTRLNESLSVGGQPAQDQLQTLKNLNVATIIDLRAASEMPFSEEKVAAALGMQYLNLPIAGASDINFANSTKLKMLLETAKTPIFLHCSSANRVGALLALSSFQEGYDPAAALRIGRVTGLTSLAPKVEDLISGTTAKASQASDTATAN